MVMMIMVMMLSMMMMIIIVMHLLKMTIMERRWDELRFHCSQTLSSVCLGIWLMSCNAMMLKELYFSWKHRTKDANSMSLWHLFVNYYIASCSRQNIAIMIHLVKIPIETVFKTETHGAIALNFGLMSIKNSKTKTEHFFCNVYQMLRMPAKVYDNILIHLHLVHLFM